MKKTVTAFLSLLCASSFCGMALTACDADKQNPEHTHTYATEWSSDDTYHWHTCTDENCTEISDKSEHNFTDGVCHCGYEATVASINEVTESEFYAALSFDGVASMTVQFVGSGYGQSSTTYLDGKKTKIYSNGMTMYVEDCDTFAYFYSPDSEQGNLYRTKVEQNSTLATLTNYKTFFSIFDFSDFTYIDGYYVGDHVFEEGTDNEYVGNIKLQFENGKLVYLRVESEVENSSVSFSAYNETTVALPANYVDVSSTPTPTPPETSSDWASYFDLPNVTITETVTYVKNGITEKLNLKCVWKQNNAAWICRQDYLSIDGSVFASNIAYFDGTNSYLNGEKTESVEWYHYSWEGLLMYLENLENCFEKSVQSSTKILYSADAIPLYGGTPYTNVQITVENKHITTIIYTYENAVMDETTNETYPATYTFTFTNYGTTKIDYTVQNDSIQILFLWQERN